MSVSKQVRKGLFFFAYIGLMHKNRLKHYQSQRAAEKHRSKFETKVINHLKLTNTPYKYESEVLLYEVPAKMHKYTPDLILDNGIYIEIKGWFSPQDRKKMLWVTEQHFDKDIRMLFQNARNKIRKGSPTTYADWCDQHGIKWAENAIPEAWINEPKKDFK